MDELEIKQLMNQAVRGREITLENIDAMRTLANKLGPAAIPYLIEIAKTRRDDKDALLLVTKIVSALLRAGFKPDEIKDVDDLISAINAFERAGRKS